MKAEARGKYGGVKVHLDGDEAGVFLAAYRTGGINHVNEAHKFQVKLGEKIDHLLKEIPNLLDDRTDEQIREAMERDLAKIHDQQAAMGEGKDWRRV